MSVGEDGVTVLFKRNVVFMGRYEIFTEDMAQLE